MSHRASRVFQQFQFPLTLYWRFIPQGPKKPSNSCPYNSWQPAPIPGEPWLRAGPCLRQPAPRSAEGHWNYQPSRLGCRPWMRSSGRWGQDQGPTPRRWTRWAAGLPSPSTWTATGPPWRCPTTGSSLTWDRVPCRRPCHPCPGGPWNTYTRCPRPAMRTQWWPWARGWETGRPPRCPSTRTCSSAPGPPWSTPPWATSAPPRRTWGAPTWGPTLTTVRSHTRGANPWPIRYQPPPPRHPCLTSGREEWGTCNRSVPKGHPWESLPYEGLCIKKAMARSSSIFGFFEGCLTYIENEYRCSACFFLCNWL